MMCSPFIVVPPSKQRSAVGGLHTRPRAFRLRRDALKPRAAGAVLLAEVYPSERYRGEKVRKYNRINRAAKSTFNAFRPKFFPAGLSSETFRCPTLPPRRRRLPPTSSTPSA